MGAISMLRSSCNIGAAPAGFLHGLVANSMHLGRSGGSSENRRLKRGEDSGGILVDHGEKGARGSFRCPAPSFPMLDGDKAEAENLREASLSHTQLVANAFDIDLLRNMHLKILFLTREKRLDIIESAHELFKLRLHNLSPAVIFKNCIGTFFKSISFSLREVLFLVFRKDRNEKNGNRVIALDIDNARSTALTFSTARNAEFAKSTSSFHDFPTLRISCNRQNNVGPLILAEEFFSSREVSGRFNNRLHYSLVLHWTPGVKKKLYAIGHQWVLLKGLDKRLRL